MHTNSHHGKQESELVGRSTAYVLSIGVVDIDRLSAQDARLVLADLSSAVLATPEYVDCKSRLEVGVHPTAEGICVAFFGKALSPVNCAIQITTAFRNHPTARLRMGIHAGPVPRLRNGKLDRNGEGLIVARFVMEVGDAGHILLSGAYYDILGHMMIGYLYLSELVILQDRRFGSTHIYNMRDANQTQPQFGNAQMPHKLRVAAMREADAPGATSPEPPLNRRKEPAFTPVKAAIAFMAVVLAATLILRISAPDAFAQYQANVARSLPVSQHPPPSAGGPVADVGPVTPSLKVPLLGGSSR
jgi:hypothetical protein